MSQQEIINELKLMEARIKVLLSMLTPAKKQRRKVDYSDQIKRSLAKTPNIYKAK